MTGKQGQTLQNRIQTNWFYNIQYTEIRTQLVAGHARNNCRHNEFSESKVAGISEFKKKKPRSRDSVEKLQDSSVSVTVRTFISYFHHITSS